jgi:bifunctional DNase/RNase
MTVTTDLELVPMRIAKVAGFAPPLADTERHFVVLEEVSGDRQLAVEIGQAEAFSLAARLQGLAFGRPRIYELTAALVQSLGGQLSEVHIDRLEDGAIAATAVLQGPIGTRPVDARASDALNLAAQAGAPVMVSPAVLADYDQRLEDEDVAPGANLLRLALTVPPMKITRAGAGA